MSYPACNSSSVARSRPKRLLAVLVIGCALTLTVILLVQNWQPLVYADIKVYRNLVTYTIEKYKRHSWLPGPRSLQLQITHEEFQQLKQKGVPAFDRKHVR